ncbi:helix-turn-helix domain-containing protein [Comamonas aquatica]|uniref:Zinc finger/helix-turn-helix protein, YgiT family n=1 Tax=Comamonas aquatica TaxID=225991 RepID=A0AA35GHB9_9BURK|nr:helix-turn-helix transcriptional regulator [Comamonas aquatica]CAB5675761.1 putative zinc finger/helix-turn-helix protein, YgiT family [Comamonas aquatica]CAC9685976.1 putative zinc finger/helix-turn-helix protein, YgiT family [Comamonas aquatica]
MNHLKTIRQRLGLTQQAIATELGCTQGNVGHYERGQMFPPEMARKLIAICAQQFGLVITFDHVYGDAKLPELPVAQAGAQQDETGATTLEA